MYFPSHFIILLIFVRIPGLCRLNKISFFGNFFSAIQVYTQFQNIINCQIFNFVNCFTQFFWICEFLSLRINILFFVIQIVSKYKRFKINFYSVIFGIFWQNFVLSSLRMNRKNNRKILTDLLYLKAILQPRMVLNTILLLQKLLFFYHFSVLVVKLD